MLPLVRMMGGVSGPTQDMICYYAGQDIYYRLTRDSSDWIKWTGNVYTVGAAGSPAGGAPYDYSNLETAFDSTSGDCAFICHYNSVREVWSNGFLTAGRNILIKGVDCTGNHTPFKSNNPNPPDGIQVNGTSGELLICEGWWHYSGENWYSAVAMGRNSNQTVIISKCRFHGAASSYMIDFYKNNQPWKGVCKIEQCLIGREYTTYIDHGDGTGSTDAAVYRTRYYNSGEGSYRCYSCARPPNPHDYVQSDVDVENYGVNYGEYFIKFGPG